MQITNLVPYLPSLSPLSCRPFADIFLSAGSALLITKWLDTVELDAFNGTQLSAKERELLALIRELLEEAENDLSESISLAAVAARTWGLFLQDVSKVEVMLVFLHLLAQSALTDQRSLFRCGYGA